MPSSSPSSKLSHEHFTPSNKRRKSHHYGSLDINTPPKQSISNVNAGASVSEHRYGKSGANVITPENKPFAYTATMDVAKSRGDVVDLTTPPRDAFARRRIRSNLQGNHQVKKLVVKNLQNEPRWDVEQYLEHTWTKLSAAIDKVLVSATTNFSIEEMYRSVEHLCRQGKAAVVYTRLHKQCSEHLRRVKSDLPRSKDDNSQTLQSVINAWSTWQAQLQDLRRMFYYLDRSYLLQQSKTSLLDAGTELFRETVFSEDGLILPCVDAACDLVVQRRGNKSPDTTLLTRAVSMFRDLGVYTSTFEVRLLAKSQGEFTQWAHAQTAQDDVPDYVSHVAHLTRQEEDMCQAAGLVSRTTRKLLALIDEHAIKQQIEFLTSDIAVASLLETNSVDGLNSLYTLLDKVKQTMSLKTPFTAWTEKKGTAIIFDDEALDDMVTRLLALKQKLDNIWNVAFCRDADIGPALRDAFARFMNKTKKTDATWGTDNSKTGEMIAKHVDLLLKGNIKAATTDSPNKADDDDDQDIDEDKKIDVQLDHVLDLFRFLQGKAVFEAFYKRDLAKRLLMGRSASADAEQNMLIRLRTECGAGFTHNLEQMFKDVDLSREEMSGYKERLEQMHTRPGGLDLDVNILSSAAWPSYPEVPVRVPANVNEAITAFEEYYKVKHTGRRLTWKHALANCQLNASFPKGKKQLVVSSFQAIVLLLFNDRDEQTGLTYDQVASESGLSEAELTRTLQSLACTKLHPLTKHPLGKDINTTDRFTLNTNFSHPKYRVRINQIQLKETKEENKQTHERVAEDRNLECQAAIVRLMKSRKTIAHSELLAEVIKATQSRGVLAMVDIKKNIDKLIEKEYMERGDGNLYNYVA